MKEQNEISAENREESRVKGLKRTLFAIIILNIPLYISFLLKRTIEYAYELPENYAENPVLNILGMWQTAWFMYIFFVPPLLLRYFL